MTTRAAYVRLFPYCAPAALFIHQMASTPVCFLFFPLYKPSPLFDKIQGGYPPTLSFSFYSTVIYESIC